MTVLSEWVEMESSQTHPLEGLRLESLGTPRRASVGGQTWRVLPGGGLGKVWGLLVVPLQDIRKPTIVFHAFLIKSELFVAEDGGQSTPFGNRPSFFFMITTRWIYEAWNPPARRLPGRAADVFRKPNERNQSNQSNQSNSGTKRVETL